MTDPKLVVVLAAMLFVGSAGAGVMLDGVPVPIPGVGVIGREVFERQAFERQASEPRTGPQATQSCGPFSGSKH
jgi:hypothetical protein